MQKANCKEVNSQKPIDELSKFMNKDFKSQYPKAVAVSKGNRKGSGNEMKYQRYQIITVSKPNPPKQTAIFLKQAALDAYRKTQSKKTNRAPNPNHTLNAEILGVKTNQAKEARKPFTTQNYHHPDTDQTKDLGLPNGIIQSHPIKPLNQVALYSSSKPSHYLGYQRNTMSSNNTSKMSSLRTSGNHISQMSSVAGVPLDQQRMKQRKESNLSSRQHQRNSKMKSVEKENVKMAKRLSSQESHYSSKKLLKEAASQEKLSKRLTSSKISQRSSRSSVASRQDSSRSIKSASSSRSSIASSPSRHSNRKVSPNNKAPNRFNLKGAAKVEIQEHNINKLRSNEVNKFRNLFANSFHAHGNNPEAQTQHLSYYDKLIKSNPYVNVEITSLTQMPVTHKGIKSKHSSVKPSVRPSINRSCQHINEGSSKTHSSHKLPPHQQSSKKWLPNLSHTEQGSVDRRVPEGCKTLSSNSTTKIGIEAGTLQDGLLHRIAEEMYQNAEDTPVVPKKGNKKQQLYNKPTVSSQKSQRQKKMYQFHI